MILQSYMHTRHTEENTYSVGASGKVAWCKERFSLWRLKCSVRHATLHEAIPGQYFFTVRTTVENMFDLALLKVARFIRATVIFL